MNQAILNPPISINRSLVLTKGLNLKKSLGILALLTVLSLFIISIAQLNSYTKEIYLIKEYETKIAQLTEESKFLEVNFSKANSLSHLGGYVQNQVFEKAGKIEYIQVLGGTAMAK